MSFKNINWTELAKNGAISYDFTFVILNFSLVIQGKVLPITCHEGREGE
jgi:hypothetical protein